MLDDVNEMALNEVKLTLIEHALLIYSEGNSSIMKRLAGSDTNFLRNLESLSKEKFSLNAPNLLI